MILNKDRPRAKLRRLALTATDFRALSYLKARHELSSESEALRWAVHQQAGRDVERSMGSGGPAGSAALFGEISGPAYDRITSAVLFSVAPSRVAGRALPGESPLLQSSFWLYPADEDAAERIGRVWGLEGRAAVVRFCLRVQALVSGFEPPGGVWV